MTEIRDLYDEARRAVADDPYTTEMANQACLVVAIARHYRNLDVVPPSAGRIPADLAERDARAASLLRRYLRAPDTRARYVFLGDVLAHVCPEALPVAE